MDAHDLLTTMVSDQSTKLQTKDTSPLINRQDTNSKTDRITIAVQHEEANGSVNIPIGSMNNPTRLNAPEDAQRAHIKQNLPTPHITKALLRRGTRGDGDRCQNNPTGDHRCDVCDKTFSGSFEANRHRRIRHDGERYICLLCDDLKHFTRKENIKTHLNRVHEIEKQDADTFMTHGRISI